MEETKDSSLAPLRLYCENESCIKPRKHFCIDHSQVLCNGCYTALHVRCKCDEIPDFRDIRECLDIVKTLFSSVRNNSESLKAGFYIKGLSDELKLFDEMLAKLDEKLTNSISDDKFFEFNLIIKEVIELQKKFVDSNSFTEFTKLKELKEIATGDNLSNQTTSRSGKGKISQDLAKFKEQVLKEMEEHNKAKVEQRAKEISENAINDCKESIRQLDDKIKKEEEINKQLSDKNVAITKELKNQAKELEAERKKVGDITAELEERKKREEEEQRDPAVRFSEIYEKNIGEKVYYYFIIKQDRSNLRNMKSTLLCLLIE